MVRWTILRSSGVMPMADASALRVLRVTVDGREIAADHRVRLRGKSTMTVFPDPWTIGIYGLTDEDLATLRRGAEVRVLGPGDTLLCAGPPADILQRSDEGRDVTQILLMEGEALWQSTVTLDVHAGATVEQTVRALLSRCSAPSPLAACPSLPATIPRGQTFFGRTVDALDELARAADCRGWVWRDAFWMTRIGEGIPRATIREDDLLRPPESMTGALTCSTRMIGLQTGQLVRLETDTRRGIYRLAAQTIDADTHAGAWDCLLTLMDETEAGLGLEAWEGIM